jgi:putative photosynthetic complex assembly protein 2
MEYYALPIFITLFVWWSSTGVIIYLAGLPDTTFKWTVAGMTLVMMFALVGLYSTRGDTSVHSAYIAFLCGIAVWAWQDVTYYTGMITGIRKEAALKPVSGLRRFWHAIQTNLWHEITIIVGGIAVFGLTWGAPNPFGWASYLVLWVMQQTAKINVFLGARNMCEELLPPHLSYLKSFFKQKPMNPFFPLNIAVSMLVATYLIWRVAVAETEFERIGTICVSTLMVLAVVEHWLLMLPLPFAKLWQWGLRSRSKQASP